MIGDYLSCSYLNTKMVLESLGFEVNIEEIMDNVKQKALQNNYKENKKFNTPVIIHTISDNTDNYFINLGFNGYLKKPIKQDETITVLEKLLHK